MDSNITGNKLTHMTHIEDMLLQGPAGISIVLNTLNDVFHALEGESTKSNIKLKIDGCVAPSTILKTNYGYKSILEIIKEFEENPNSNIEIEGYDEEEKKEKFFKLKNIFSSYGEKSWLELKFDNNTSLFCTKDHLIYTKNRGWIEAENLSNEDVFLS